MSGADAAAALADAQHLAAKKHRRVLLVWGSDAREGDLELHRLLRRGKAGAWPFYYDFVVTPIDESARSAAFAESLGAPTDVEGPLLSVLDASGAPLAHRAAAEFGASGWNDEAAKALGAFLTPLCVEPQDAEVVMRAALDRATRENKRLFVHLGAPW